jgi:hypothetical protein
MECSCLIELFGLTTQTRMKQNFSLGCQIQLLKSFLKCECAMWVRHSMVFDVVGFCDVSGSLFYPNTH